MQDLVIVGTGQMGRWFAEAGVRAGRRVVPIRRQDDACARLGGTSIGTPIVVSVPEAALAETVARLPVERVPDTVLVQNGLFAADFAALGLDASTILAVWTLRKAGQPYIVAQRTGAWGRHAQAVAEVLGAHEVPVVELASEHERDVELVAKYGFILAVNALGVGRDATIAEWLRDEPAVVDAALGEGTAIAATFAPGVSVSDALPVAGAGLRGFGAMRAAGRSAPARVARALERAEAAGLDVPVFRRLAGLATR